jgi:glycosyltransferase involved in cell wall biosynthesis
MFDRVKAPGSAAPARRRIVPRNPHLLYRMWRLERMPWRDDLYRQRLASRAMRYRPAISIITPLFDTPPDLLDRMLRSVVNQTYPYWEHCLVDDGSSEEWLARYLERCAADDPRVRFQRRSQNGGIVAASNDAISLATGEFVSMLDHDDELAPEALYEFVRRLNARPETDVLYSDFDLIDRQGRHGMATFLPDWSPELLPSVPYVAHLTAYRRSIVEEVGRWRPGFEGSQDFDLALRVATISDRFEHVPKVLYHWRQWERSVAGNPTAKPYAYEALERAVADHFTRLGVDAVRHPTKWIGIGTIRYALSATPLVSVIATVPAGLAASRSAQFVTELAALLQRGGYDRTETVIVAPTDMVKAVGAAAAGMPARVVACPNVEDFAAAANAGAAAASGEQLLFVGAALSAQQDDWIAALLEYAQQAPIGVVGPKIFRNDGSLWDGGLVLPRGVPHRIQQERGHDLVNYSAVSGTCLMTRRATFEQAGGFQPAAAVGYPDIDYCLRLRALGYRHVITPHANLTVLSPPAPDRNAAAQALFSAVWGKTMTVDPYYNPNFRQDDATFSIALTE